MEKGFYISFKGKKLYIEFLSVKNTNFAVYDENTGIGEVFYSIDCSNVLQALLFENTCFIEGTWSEKKFLDFIKRLE